MNTKRFFILVLFTMLVVSLQAATPSINEEITDFSDTTSIVTLVHQGKETYYYRSQLNIAVQEAQAGDTIMFGEGRYTQNIEIDKPLTLIGTPSYSPYLLGKIIILKDIPTFCLQNLNIYSSSILNGKVNTFYIKNCYIHTVGYPIMTKNQVGHLIVNTCDVIGETEQDSITFTNCNISYTRAVKHTSYTHCDFKISNAEWSIFGNFTNCYLTAIGEGIHAEGDATFSYCAIEKNSTSYFKYYPQDHCIEVEDKNEQHLGNDGTPIGNNELWYEIITNESFESQNKSLNKEMKQIKIKAKLNIITDF